MSLPRRVAYHASFLLFGLPNRRTTSIRNGSSLYQQFDNVARTSARSDTQHILAPTSPRSGQPLRQIWQNPHCWYNCSAPRLATPLLRALGTRTRSSQLWQSSMSKETPVLLFSSGARLRSILSTLRI